MPCPPGLPTGGILRGSCWLTTGLVDVFRGGRQVHCCRPFGAKSVGCPLPLFHAESCSFLQRDRVIILCLFVLQLGGDSHGGVADPLWDE